MTEAGKEQAISRLTEAWRGEVQANAVYSILARREKDPRRADVIRRMAEGEVAHRGRIEARLRELGAPVPAADSVRLPLMLRWQAQLAPLHRVLARMEEAENDEIVDRYKRPTGDAETDQLLGEIRSEEKQHASNVRQLKAGDEGGAIDPGGPQARLDRILGRERWHRSGGGWISGAIYGANDGLAAVFGIVAGVSGATGGSNFVLLAGVSGAVASALSMATGAFLAERSTSEVAAANLARERREVEDNPHEEQEELSLFYQLKGLDRELADQVAARLAEDPEAMLKALAAEELGGVEMGSPVQAALAAGISTGLGAMIPVIPFFFIHGTTAIVLAFVVSLIAHFLVGAAKALFTLRTWYGAGLEMTLAGVLVGGGTFAVGLLFPGAR